MARENQGLHIALIVCVMLTIVLGVTTYVFYRREGDARAEASRSQAEAAKKDTDFRKLSDNFEILKQHIVGDATAAKAETITSLTSQFEEDKKKYGGAYSEEDQAYHRLLEKQAKTLESKTDELAKAKAEVQKWKEDYAVREANKAPQIRDFSDQVAKANKELEEKTSKFKADRERILKEAANIQADLVESRKESKAAEETADANLKDAGTKLESLTTKYKQKAEKVNEMTAEIFDAPLGEVRLVNQRTGTVWINLGRADSLRRQVTFSVFPVDITNLVTSAKKASIEVTQILGDHLAEARVIDDKTTDPIMPGDKIYTPVWSLGEQKHFAITGFIDIDGDGKSDLSKLINIITMNGGVVDCYLDDKGEVSGDITTNTRYVVYGEEPDKNGHAALAAGDKKIDMERMKLGIQKIPLREFLERMGWKNTAPVVRYGLDKNPKDFEPKPPEGGQKKSTGKVFEPREPRLRDFQPAKPFEKENAK